MVEKSPNYSLKIFAFKSKKNLASLFNMLNGVEEELQRLYHDYNLSYRSCCNHMAQLFTS